MNQEKVCKECNKKKSLDEFYSRTTSSKSKGKYVYHHPECKECTKKRTVRWQKDNPDKNLENKRKSNVKHRKVLRDNSKKRRENGEHKKWVLNNPEKIRNYNRKHQNKKHNITKKEWEKCKAYFDFRCAYCGITKEENYKENKMDFHKEHVDHNGANDLSNCVPACRNCNSQKWEFDINDWYNEKNNKYTTERYNKIIAWIEGDYSKML